MEEKTGEGAVLFFIRSFHTNRLLRSGAFLLVLCIIIFCFCLGKQRVATAASSQPLMGRIIAVDAGHGGSDPGAVGVSGSEEKTINLQLALLLQKELERYGATVVMTRTEDMCYSDVKKEDLDARADLVSDHEGEILLSMQCNADPDPRCCGAQVFYHPQSEQGEKLAKAIQKAVLHDTDQLKEREAQSLNGPYLMKAVAVPVVIVEAGFLSHSEEETMLLDEDYQKKIAAAVCRGVVNYYEKADAPSFFSLFRTEDNN